MVLWDENIGAIMALDSQNLPLKLRERVEITRISFYILENANFFYREIYRDEMGSQTKAGA